MRAAEEAARRPPTPPEPTIDRSELPTADGPTETNITGTTSASANKGAKPAGVLKKKVAKPKLTAKEKRERGLEMERLLSALPLEWRGNDPNLRRHMETVVEKFWDNPDEGFSSTFFCTYLCILNVI